MVMYFQIILLFQVLHSTAVRQLEIAELLDKLQESKCHVSIRVNFLLLNWLPSYSLEPSL
jgi:hypothetical protein